MAMVETTGRDSKFIGNFTLTDIGEVDVITETGIIPSVKFKIKFDNGSISEDTTLPLEELGKLDWYSLHPHLKLCQKLPTAQQNLMNLIRSALPNSPKQTQYQVKRLGTHTIDGEPVYNTGGDLIRCSPITKNCTNILLVSQGYNLDIDQTLNESEAAAEMMKIVSLCPDVGRVIFSHLLLYIMRKAYKDAVIAPCCSLFLYGGSGQFKTTYSTFLTQIHNRSKGILRPDRLNSSIPGATELIYKKSDCVVVLDDLCPRDSKKTMAQQEETLLEIARIIADGTRPAKFRGHTVPRKEPPSCGVLFTGEYLIGTGSDAARLLPIRLTTPIDKVKLSECQAKPLVVSTFFHYYIKWYIEKYSTIQDLLRKWWEKYTKTDLGVHRRLQETHFFLNTANKIFLQYCMENGLTSPEKASVHHQSFENLLNCLVQAQDVRVKQGIKSNPNNVDFFDVLCALYKNGDFHVAKNRKRFNSSSSKYDGLIHNELLC
ncbi:hypothetical protein, partial [Anaerospora hongkongensis]|uniref:hypothetical protein n=1 Tax=Anaerospora hongkongensis TaxID=244830 RepID=UPI002FDA50CB